MDQRLLAEGARLRDAFDEEWYRWFYPDVQRALERGEIDSGFSHFVEMGASESRSPNPYFEEWWYVNSNGDVAAAIRDREFLCGWEHYCLIGAREGRWPSRWVDPRVLRASSDGSEKWNHSLSQEYLHHIKRGARRGELASKGWNESYYLDNNPEARRAIARGRFASGLEHYLRQGVINHPRLPPDKNDNGKRLRTAVCERAQRELERFFQDNASLDLHASAHPLLSVVIPVHNRAELTLRCLRSLLAQIQHDEPGKVEVLVVDNGSTDSMARLLRQCQGVRVLSQKENLGFVAATNLGAQVAKGEFFLLLNNDIEIHDGLWSALSLLQDDPDVAVVGGKLLNSDGSLQEMGSGITHDGWPYGYGRGDVPFRYDYLSLRETHYCTGALFLTSRKLFQELEGLDPLFVPGYFEDADYCFRAASRGLRTMAHPAFLATHLEHATYDGCGSQWPVFHRNRSMFLARHRPALRPLSWEPPGMVPAPQPLRRRDSVLIIDDIPPVPGLGGGAPRSRSIIEYLRSRGFHCTVAVTNSPDPPTDASLRTTPHDVEVVDASSAERLEAAIRTRLRDLRLLWVSRPHNMARVMSLRDRPHSATPGAPVVYDAEALFSLRDRTEAKVLGASAHPSGWWERQTREEVSLGLAAACVTAVSEAEARRFRDQGCPTFVVSHGCTITANEDGEFDRRRDLLFVGSIQAPTAPNLEGLGWFVERVLPLVKRAIGDCKLRVAGFWSPEVKKPDWPSHLVQLDGGQDDLQPLYRSCRVFVAPVRFGAGLPFKIHEAAAAGIPVCTTDVMTAQLGWHSGREILSSPGNDPQSFAKNVVRLYRDERQWQATRDQALETMSRHHGPDSINESVAQVLHHLRIL